MIFYDLGFVFDGDGGGEYERFNEKGFFNYTVLLNNTDEPFSRN